jgi:hypothetical protein
LFKFLSSFFVLYIFFFFLNEMAKNLIERPHNKSQEGTRGASQTYKDKHRGK